MAVKHILPYGATPEGWARVDTKTRRETVVWMKLDHPNIVKLLGTKTDESPHRSTGMVSRWMANGNLGNFITSSLPLAHRQQIVSKLFPALDIVLVD